MQTKQFLISRIIKVLIIVITLVSCSNSKVNDITVGKYASKMQSKIVSYYNWYLFNTIYSIGDTLTITKNSRFTFHTCGNFSFGSYQIKSDTLFLNYDSSYTLSDRIMNYSNYTDTFILKDSKTLITMYEAKFSNESIKTHKGATELHFIDE